MMAKVLSVVFLSCLVVACGGSSDPVLPAYTDGDYDLTATATTDLDINGGTCGDGTGTMTLSEGVISGSALSTNGNTFDITGNIAADGTVEGGFAVSGELAVNFEGSVTGTEGSGTWKDLLECEGTWSVVKAAELL